MDIDVKDMTEEQAKKFLQRIIDCLDEDAQEDYFGSEGWKHRYGFED